MKIAILGYGTVGRGVAQIIEERVPEVEVASSSCPIVSPTRV